MSTIHVFAAIATPCGTASNNRGEVHGCHATMKKVMHHGKTHTQISSAALRRALRQQLDEMDPHGTNRKWDSNKLEHSWEDPAFNYWDPEKPNYADDDMMGFMAAEAAKEEGARGTCNARGSVIEFEPAISMTPFMGEVHFCCAAKGASPNASKKDNGPKAPAPYSVEVHNTRYQYSLAMTPENLCESARAMMALRAITRIHDVAGNHARFLFDYSPESIVIRVSESPVSRIMGVFSTNDFGETVSLTKLAQKVDAGDITSGQNIERVFIGGAVTRMDQTSISALEQAGCQTNKGVDQTVESACEYLQNLLAETK